LRRWHMRRRRITSGSGTSHGFTSTSRASWSGWSCHRRALGAASSSCRCVHAQTTPRGPRGEREVATVDLPLRWIYVVACWRADLGLPDEARPFHVHDDGHSDTVWQRAMVPVAARLAPPAPGQNNQHIINQHIINQHRAILGASSALIEGNTWGGSSVLLSVCVLVCVCQMSFLKSSHTAETREASIRKQVFKRIRH